MVFKFPKVPGVWYVCSAVLLNGVLLRKAYVLY